MKPIVSKYKFSALLIRGFILIVSGFLPAAILFEKNTTITTDLVVFLIIWMGIPLWLILRNFDRLVIDEHGITFKNPVFPFIKHTRCWDYYQCFITTDERAKYSSYEAIWLIKNDKISDRISSASYSNYEDIRDNIKTPFTEKVRLGHVEQLAMILSIKDVRTFNYYDE